MKPIPFHSALLTQIAFRSSQKLYDLNFSKGCGKFVVGGGGDGMVNVWGLEDDEESVDGGVDEEEAYEDGKAARTEWCWRASKNWLSGADFLPTANAGGL